MKKLYTTPEYKKWHKRRLVKLEKKFRKKRVRQYAQQKLEKPRKSNKHQVNDIKLPVVAPSDLRLIEKTSDCLAFLRDLRNEDFQSKKGQFKFVVLSLKNVTQIDYGTISILTAIIDDLKYKQILVRGDLPVNQECKKFMIDSGYLNNLFDDNGKPFKKAEKSEMIFFEKGCGMLSENDNKKISLLIKNVVNHLTGSENHCLPLRTIILEICGNSIEWGNTENKQWLLGVKYETEKIVFTVSDVGKGILETLHRKFKHELTDTFTMKSNDEILKGAFDKKYGSATQEANRNKGLPAVKINFQQGTISALKVLTNNVILHFDNDSLSRTFDKGSARFKGTFYQWEMTNNCLTNITAKQ